MAYYLGKDLGDLAKITLGKCVMDLYASMELFVNLRPTFIQHG